MKFSVLKAFAKYFKPEEIFISGVLRILVLNSQFIRVFKNVFFASSHPRVKTKGLGSSIRHQSPPLKLERQTTMAEVVAESSRN